MSYQKDSRPSKARIKSPPLSGGEVARKTEEKGRGLSERSEFRRPRRRLRRQTQKPDNRGGASWFVLLAAEKNEQIKRINVTRTFFDRERKSLVFNLLPLPCPVCGVSHCNERRVTLTLLPCVFARKYRGELRSVATRRGIKKTSNGSNRGGLEYKQAPIIAAALPGSFLSLLRRINE